VVNVLTVSAKYPFATQKIGDYRDSNIQNREPRETMGIATATTVGAFCDPARATAPSRNRSADSAITRKIDAGLKLYRRNRQLRPPSQCQERILHCGTMSPPHSSLGLKTERIRREPVKAINQIEGIGDP